MLYQTRSLPELEVLSYGLTVRLRGRDAAPIHQSIGSTERVTRLSRLAHVGGLLALSTVLQCRALRAYRHPPSSWYRFQ